MKTGEGAEVVFNEGCSGKHHLTFGGTALSCAQLVQAGAGRLPHDDAVTVSSMDGRLGQVPVPEGSWVAHQRTTVFPHLNTKLIFRCKPFLGFHE